MGLVRVQSCEMWVLCVGLKDSNEIKLKWCDGVEVEAMRYL